MKEKLYFHNKLSTWNKTPEDVDIKDDFAQYMLQALNVKGIKNMKIGYNTIKADCNDFVVSATIKPVQTFANIRKDNMIMAINVKPKNNPKIAKVQGEYIIELAKSYLGQTF